MKLGFVSAILSCRQAALRLAGNVLRSFFGNFTRPVSNPA